LKWLDTQLLRKTVLTWKWIRLPDMFFCNPVFNNVWSFSDFVWAIVIQTVQICSPGCVNLLELPWWSYPSISPMFSSYFLPRGKKLDLIDIMNGRRTCIESRRGSNPAISNSVVSPSIMTHSRSFHGSWIMEWTRAEVATARKSALILHLFLNWLIPFSTDSIERPFSLI
jgi:hypothetical protein